MAMRHKWTSLLAVVLAGWLWTPGVAGVDLTYEGEFIDDRGRFYQMSVSGTPVTSRIVLVGDVSPVRDAWDPQGNRYCWFLVDHEAGLKVMVASQPVVADAAYSAGMTAQQVQRASHFLATVHAEVLDSGGAEKLSAECAARAKLIRN